MRRAEKRAGLGPYYVRPGSAPPCSWERVRSKELPSPPPGMAAPVLRGKPDSWTWWPKLASIDADRSVPASVLVATNETGLRVPQAVVPCSGLGQRVDEAALKRVAGQWLACLQPLIESAPAFMNLGELASVTLERLLLCKASSTLRRYLPNWRLWLDFAQHHAWPVFDPPEADVVAFFAICCSTGSAKPGPKTHLAA